MSRLPLADGTTVDIADGRSIVRPLTLLLRQRPDHVAHVGDTIMVDGDPFVIRDRKPKREAGVFLDWGQTVEYNEVELTIERFDGMPA